MKEIITKAIENKQKIQFDYKDEVIVVEPYIFGISKKGNDQLRAFQTEGGSNSNFLGWRLFSTDKIDNITILNDKFESIQDGYNPKDSAMIFIYRFI